MDTCNSGKEWWQIVLIQRNFSGGNGESPLKSLIALSGAKVVLRITGVKGGLVDCILTVLTVRIALNEGQKSSTSTGLYPPIPVIKGTYMLKGFTGKSRAMSRGGG